MTEITKKPALDEKKFDELKPQDTEAMMTAFLGVSKALHPLDVEDRRRVMNAVFVLLVGKTAREY
jgi:hypothetical protein